jgi:hypothetical protein
MKKVFLLIAVAAFYGSAEANAQQYATTDEGQRVLLKDNGLWERVMAEDAPMGGPVNLSKSPRSRHAVKGKQIPYEIWYNHDKWTVLGESVNSFAEYSLHHKDGDVIAAVVAERIQVDLDKLVEIALNNLKNTASEYRIVDWNTATINNHQGKLLQLNAVVQGIHFTYLIFYFSNERGSFQLMTFTSNNLFAGYQKDLMELISGFVVN